MSKAVSYVKRTVGSLALVSGLYVGAVGFAHTAAGRPLLPYLGLGKSVGGCPMGKEPSPQALEAHRVATLKEIKGGARAPAQDALGFTLSRTTKGEVKAWAAAKGLTCKTQLQDQAYECIGVPGEAFAPALASKVDALFFRFEPGGKLVALDAQSSDKSGTGEAAVRSYGALAQGLEKEMGTPTAKYGEATASAEGAAYYTAGPYRRSAVEYRFQDVAVDLSVMSLPQSEVLVRAQFRALD